VADPGALASAVVGLAAVDDSAGVAAALQGLSETERRTVWRALKPRALSTTAASVAAFGCAPGAKSAADAAWAPLLDVAAAPLAVQVLSDRRPTWLDDLATRLVAQETAVIWGFAVVRGLVRDEIIAAPTDPSYVLAMVWGVAPAYPRSTQVATPLAALRADPGLLERELWDLLGTERAGRKLAWVDGWRLKGVHIPGRAAPEPHPEATWRHALVTLSGEGTVPRDRLLDAALHAMLADWAAADVGWFIDLHDALAPSAEELAVRGQTYVRLLGSDVGRVVQVGLRAAGTLIGSDTVESSTIVRALEPALLRTQKGTAKEALKLLTCLGDGDPACQGLVTEVARSGLDHPRADVREQARALGNRWHPAQAADVPEARAAVPEVAPAVASTLAPVEPLTDSEELAELLAHLIEEADDPVAVERALDGVLRFGNARPTTAETLARRAAERVTELYPEPWSGKEVRSDLAALTLVWLGRIGPGRGYEGRVVDRKWEERGPGSPGAVTRLVWPLGVVVTRRIHEVAISIRDEPRRLLSLPTSSDGSLAASVLRERMRGLRAAPPLDLELALLRVPPEQHHELRLPLLLRGRGGAARALALLDATRPAWDRVVGPTTVWWRPQPTMMIGWSDPLSPAATADRLVATLLDRRAPLLGAGLDANAGEFAARPEQVTAMWPLMLPHHLDHLAAHAHPRLARALEKNRSGAVPVIEAIGRSPQRGAAPTTSALVLGFAAKDPAVRTAAIDAFVLRVGRDLIDPAGMAEQIQFCLVDDLVVGTRIADSLREAARADRVTATTALAVLSSALESLPGRRDAHRWVELVADLSNELDRPIALPPAFRDLARSADRSVLAAACRRVRSAD
jgi:hypothetical protein